MSEWQPIETAPTTVPLLLWGPLTRGVCIGFWNDDFGCWDYSGRTPPTKILGKLTHWMPLPDPPAGDPDRSRSPR